MWMSHLSRSRPGQEITVRGERPGKQVSPLKHSEHFCLLSEERQEKKHYFTHSAWFSSDDWGQEAANSSCKGPESEYLQLGWPYGLCHNCSPEPLQSDSKYRWCESDWVWLCMDSETWISYDSYISQNSIHLLIANLIIWRLLSPKCCETTVINNFFSLKN